MSKLQLKKEIKNLTREQLEQLLLDAYDARKETKEYFDFFLNPDVEKLTEKYKVSISTEFSRSKRGHSKARISVIRKLLKEFASFHPGFDKEIDLQFYVVNFALMSEDIYYFSDTLMQGVATIMTGMIDLADRNLVADRLISQLTTLLNDESIGTRYFRRLLRESLEQYRPQ